MHRLKAKPEPYVASAACPYVREANTHLEFSSVLPYCQGLGLDIGPGGNRFSDTVLSIDSNPTADCDMCWDFLRDGSYPFMAESFDFIFASHVIEDFAPEDIQRVFNEWMRIIKPGGYLCLLVPDMQGERYPDVDDKWMPDDELVKKGERKAGDCRGNNAHRITMGSNVLKALVLAYQGPRGIVQFNTLPKDQMTMDCVVQKLL
jgi:SAM-dependent methyltransferase